MSRQLAGLLVGVLAALCFGATGVASAAVQTIDDRFAAVAREAPAFGGMFIDGKNLKVYLTNHGPAQRAGAERAVRKTFARGELPANLRVLSARFSFSRLKAWHDQVSADVLSLPGVVETDIDDRWNRLTVGVESREARDRVEARLAVLRIPRNAVSLKMVGPDEPATNLRDRHRPLVGGLQIAYAGTTSNFVCTMFNARRGDVGGFVTNSHCTRTQGGVENTAFHQPTISGTTNQVGVETVDPPYLTGGSCPAGRRCRFSDSAFARRVASVGALRGSIALSGSSVSGSCPPTCAAPAWNGTDTLRITSEMDGSSPVVGQAIAKVGRTTGRTGGSVTQTCTNSNRAPDITLRCQSRASYVSWRGDSGSAVHIRTNNPANRDVTLVGINNGIGTNMDGTFRDSVFSPFTAVQGDLGEIDTCAPGFTCVLI